MSVPQYGSLFNPVLEAMHRLGGSAEIAEMEDEVISSLDLSPADLAQGHDARSTEVEYRLAWARSYLKVFGLLDNTSRGVWVLTRAGQDCMHVDDACGSASSAHAGAASPRDRHAGGPACALPRAARGSGRGRLRDHARRVWVGRVLVRRVRAYDGRGSGSTAASGC
jgi:restriction endonuclease Mrr